MISIRQTFLVPVELLKDRTNPRSEFDDLDDLALSLTTLGQLSPLTVVPDFQEDGCWEVKNGGRRLRAARDICGWEQLRCEHVDYGTTEQAPLLLELATIDANLQARALRGPDLDFALARQREIYEILNPGTQSGTNQHTKSEAERFTKDKAKQLGVSETVVKDALRRAEHLTPKAAEAYRKGELPKTEATLLASVPAVAQDALLAEAFKAGNPQEARKILRAGLKAESIKRREDRTEKRIQKLKVDVGSAKGKSGIEIRMCDVRSLVTSCKGVNARLVHADPPWTYRNQGTNGTADNHYEGMTIKDIGRVVQAMYACAAEDAYLLLWITPPMLKDWFDETFGDTLEWKFKSAGVWAKTGRHGIGVHWRGDSEILLMYTKGEPKPLTQDLSNLHVAERSAHSEKPEDWLTGLVRGLCGPQGQVLDFWAGMAPVARAAQTVGCGYLGAELDEKRCKEARLLLAKANKELAEAA